MSDSSAWRPSGRFEYNSARVSESPQTPLRVEIGDAGGTVVGMPQRVAEALGKLGIDARVVPLEAVVATRADAVVLRGDVPGVLSIIRSLRDDGACPDTPILLLGTPEGTGPFEEGPGFGAEHVLPKDASAARIADALRRITGRVEPPLAAEERRVEHTLELSKAGEWRTHDGAVGLPPERPSTPAEEPPAISEIVPAPELSAVFDSDAREPRRRAGSQPDASRYESVAPGTGSGISSPGTGSVPGTSQIFVAASISDELRKVLYDADRRVFPDRPPIDVSLPRGEDAARDLVPDEFIEALSLALDEPERADLELTFVGAVPRPEVGSLARGDASRNESARAEARNDDLAPDGRAHDGRAHGGRTPSGRAEPAQEAPDLPEEPPRPRTHPGTPTSMSRRPGEAETRSSAADPRSAPRPHLREDVLRASQPPASLLPEERGELTPLGAWALLGQLALGRLDASVSLRVEGKPVVLSLVRGELVGASGEGWTELRRRALHRALEASLGTGRAVEASRGEPTFAYERASRLADEAALGEVLAHAEGSFAIDARPGDVAPRLTQRSLAPTLFDLARRLGPDRVLAVLLGGVEEPTASRFERLARVVVRRHPTLERVLDALEAPRELAWLVRGTTATQPVSLAELVASAPDEPGLVGAVLCIAQLGGLVLEVGPPVESLAHTDLDARAEKAILALRERADRADYFAVLGIGRDADGAAVVEAHYRLRGELLAWPLADLGLAHLEPDRTRILATLDEAAEVLSDPRLRVRYARGLEGAPAR